jgi:tetratricopeptide (TPR) repeat protein/TolB-like protein
MVAVDSTILHYRIIDKLGQGGMGVVYKAEDTRLRRTVALKFLPDELTSDADAKRRFVREAQAASKLDHPNICSIHEIEEAPDGRLFICMSFCDGITLSERMKQGTMPLPEALDIIIQVAEGLREAHQEGIVHRDIKPGNIMLSSRGQAKILDFGLARIENATRLSRTGGTMGTVRYMSPEQITSHAVDHRTDIWSLGVVLYELVAGRVPFDGAYEVAILYEIAHEAPAAYSTPTRGIPSALNAIIERSLQKEPGRRYQAMDEMLVDLKSVRDAHATEKKSGRGAMRVDGRKEIALRRGATIAYIIAAIALVLVLAMGKGFLGVSKPVSIAAFGLEHVSADSAAIGMADDLLLTKLNRHRGVRTLTRNRIRDVSKELGIGPIRDCQSAFAIAKRANAGFVAFSRVYHSGDTIRASASFYDTQRRTWLFAEHVERMGGALDPNELLDDLSARIVDKLKTAAAPRTNRPSATSAMATPYAKALQLYVEGEAIYQSGDPVRGIPRIESAVAIDSTLTPALHRLALWCHHIDDDEGAHRYARRAVEISGDDPLMSIRSRIIEHRVLGRTDEAIRDMQRYLREVPEDISMNLDLGYALYTETCRFNEAVYCLRKVLELDPEDLEGRRARTNNYLGHAYMYMDNYDAADSYLRAFEKLMQGNADAVQSLAMLRRAQGRYKDAIDLCSQAIEKDPSFYPAYDELAAACLAIGQWHMALKKIEHYIVDAPPTMLAGAHYLVSLIHFAQEEYDAAQREAERALANNATSLRANWLLGRIALARGRIDLARAEYRIVDRLIAGNESPDDRALGHNLLGWLLMAGDSVREGLGELEKASELSCRDFHYMDKDLARGYLRAGKADQAESIALGLRAINANDGEILYLLGCACERQGEKANAQRFFQDARNAWREADLDYRPLKMLISKLAKL